MSKAVLDLSRMQSSTAALNITSTIFVATWTVVRRFSQPQIRYFLTFQPATSTLRKSASTSTLQYLSQHTHMSISQPAQALVDIPASHKHSLVLYCSHQHSSVCRPDQPAQAHFDTTASHDHSSICHSQPAFLLWLRPVLHPATHAL